MSSGIININNQPSVGGISIKYGDFGNANPELTNKLPTSVNLGLTSPGFLDNASECSGIDFVNINNKNNDNITFSQCLDKFQDQFSIPQLGFASLMKNLPYTFSALNREDKEYYIKELKNFINSVDKNKKTNENNKENFTSDHSDHKEHFGQSKKELNEACIKIPNIEINNILVLIIIILIGIIGFNLLN